MSAETRRFYEFGSFRLDPGAKTLFCENQPVSLTPKVFDTLQFFVENAGCLLEKDKLMQNIWRDRFVEESNLTFNIKMLRRALKDNAHQPTFIETVPRRGYRFIAEVREGSVPIAALTNPNLATSPAIELPLPTSMLPVSTSRSKKTVNRLFLLIAAVGVLAISSIGIAKWFSNARATASGLSAPILSAPFKSANFSNGGSVHAVITPDGKYVAYTNEIGGKQSIWLRQLATAENIQIVPPSDDSYLGLAISHSGSDLYFVRRERTEPALSAVYRVMTFGGIPVKITERTEGPISISPDDRQISFVRCSYQLNDYCSLFVTGADGKNERKLLTRPSPISISDNQFSPDGKSIAFASGQSWTGGSDFRLLKFDLVSGSESQISPKTFFNIRSVKWLPAGDGLLFTAKENLDGRLRIWQVSTATGETKAVTNDPANYDGISLDNGADKMVATHVSNSFRIQLAPVTDSNKSWVVTAARSFTFTPGGKIIYSADDGDIWSINQDGSGQRQLTNSTASDFAPRVSPDGRYIFFASNRTGSNHVWRMNVDGSDQIQITKQESGYPRFITVDLKWVYFDSGLRRTLWKVSTETGEEIQISPARVCGAPSFSPDGLWVAYFLRDSEKCREIAVMSLGDGKVVKTFTVADAKSLPTKIAWASDNLSFYYVTENGPQHSLWRQYLDQNNSRWLAELGNEEVEDFALSPDGSTFAFIRGKWIHDAVLIEGLK